MAKKKGKKNVIQPWCWYCEREFEDEKVLMQHQKAKHFKCGMCPRRLNTAGGLAVHIQQVHKLEPDNLPRIDNALPGRDGYEVEIFGMEGIPAPDVADYKRRKEIEFGLAAGSISQPQPKRQKTDNKPMTEGDLRAALEAHKALMGANKIDRPTSGSPATSGAVTGAPQTYAASPNPGMPGTPAAPTPMPGAPPFWPPPPGIAGAPPFPMVPGMPFPPPPPGMVLPPGMPLPPPGMFGAPLPPGGFPPPFATPPPNFVPPMGQVPFPPPSGSVTPATPASAVPTPSPSVPPVAQVQRQPTLPNPSLAQTLPAFKKETDLKWKDPNFSPEEHRALHPKYFTSSSTDGSAQGEVPRGKKRAHAGDFI
ncbi:hypothetical protein CYLTODRAFT_388773 [Cylindrobasidium torrendii FP15055 ss-10]|uniref:C2H2-type domain-containing protein n=1 Tax=Cylindrobasidium torrendii FP15055 ss-10 TaxID=1314674 RepID=A0A0D7BS10_9AGAR|nr:hypothetical protein CYLTODRAFT_388773 [Cylindrobasidium torrendii FP15055 ss-10]